MPASARRCGWLAAGSVALLLTPGCGGETPAPAPAAPVAPSELQRATVGLTERLESESFAFHFAPGDGARIEVERSEAFHRWAVGYLGVTPPKKIDFYMFRSREELQVAFGQALGGRAFPSEFSVATAYSWHNHECFHLYTTLIGNPPRIFAEGMVVAHEFDPYNDVWYSQWNRAEPYPEPHLVVARRLMAEGRLYPIESILASDDFNRRVEQDTSTIAYEEAGAWVSYLVQTYGLDKMKQIVSGIPYIASRETVRTRFEALYGLSLAEAEAAWLAWLEQVQVPPPASSGRAVGATAVGRQSLHRVPWRRHDRRAVVPSLPRPSGRRRGPRALRYCAVDCAIPMSRRRRITRSAVDS